MFIKKIVCTTLLLSVAQSAFAHKKIIPLTVTYDNYKAVVLQAKLPVILDLYSPWCGPCQKLMAIFEELAEELHGSYIFARLNVDEEPMLATELGVATVPTLIFYKNGVKQGKTIGFKKKPELLEAIIKYLE